MNNYIFVLSFGRTGSTLVTSLIKEQVNSNSFSQEINFEKVLLLIYQFKTNSITKELFLKEINNYISAVKEFHISKKTDKQITHPHYNNVNANGRIFLKQLDNPFHRLINVIMRNIFGKDNKISGCKILIENESASLENKFTSINTQNVLEIIKCFDNNPNIRFVYNYRDYEKMTISRRVKGFTHVISKETYLFYIDLVKNNQISSIKYDNLYESLKKFITEIGYKFEKKKYDMVVHKRHSY